MKLQNSKDKEKILKTTREKAQITYSETIVTLIAIMLSATIKAERLKISIKMLKYVNLEFYTPGNFSKCENRIKTFLKKAAAAAAKSLQSCLTLCDPIDGSPPGSPVPGILQARTLEWVANSFSNAWKWKVKVKSLSRVRLLATPWTTAHQAPPYMGFVRLEYWSGVPLPSPSKEG